MTSCDGCVFTRLPRAGDITLGDFWGCPEQWHDNRGVSVALGCTTLGLQTLEKLAHSGRIILQAADLAIVIKGNQRLVNSEYVIPANRRLFLNGVIAGEGFGSLKKKVLP